LISSYGSWVRWTLAAMVLATSAVLGAAVWLGQRGIERVADIVMTGQGHTLLAAYRDQEIALGRLPTREELGAFVAREEGLGLRYLALLDEDRRVIVDAGTHLDAGWDGAGRVPWMPPHVPVRTGSRVRLLSAPPIHDRRDLPAPPFDPAPFPPLPGHEGRHPPPAVLIEYEPMVLAALRREAQATVAGGVAAVVALALLALVFARVLRHRDELEARLARDRQLAALGEMSAVLAHEIRNPLTAVKGHAQLLAEILAPGTRERDKADRVVREAVRLEVLCESLLDFVRAGRVDRREVDPGELLCAAVESTHPDRVDVDLDGAPARWSLDAVQLEQVLVNLLDNALAVSPEGRRVEAAVLVTDGQLVFTVRDHGEGIQRGEEARIFEPFHTTKARGTGLGLSVARRVVELHHGTITARTHPDGGAIFTIALPA
jgi:two-component system, NtrC family, sensor histidine kinase HydH